MVVSIDLWIEGINIPITKIREELLDDSVAEVITESLTHKNKKHPLMIEIALFCAIYNRIVYYSILGMKK